MTLSPSRNRSPGSRWGLFLLLPLVGALSACVTSAGEEELLDADFEVFVEEVQPLFAEKCASPSCHGSVDRPLQLYAMLFHRQDPEDIYLSEPLTDEELRLNYQQTRVFIEDYDKAEETPLLLKPLTEAEGGVPHKGGVQILEREGNDYRLLHDWIEDAMERSP